MAAKKVAEQGVVNTQFGAGDRVLVELQVLDVHDRGNLVLSLDGQYVNASRAAVENAANLSSARLRAHAEETQRAEREAAEQRAQLARQASAAQGQDVTEPPKGKPSSEKPAKDEGQQAV